LLIWAYYNYFRFRGVERRKHCKRVTVADLAARYQIAPEALDRWRQARRLVVHHDGRGQIVWAETSDYGAPGTMPAGPSVSNSRRP
jgi:biofilm PGA synthesis protein PgaD